MRVLPSLFLYALSTVPLPSPQPLLLQQQCGPSVTYTISSSPLAKLGSGGTSEGVYRVTGLAAGEAGVLKVARISAQRLVSNECAILKHLERSRVPNVERCVAQCGRSIVLTPLFERDAADGIVVSTLSSESIPGEVPRRRAVAAVMTTLVQTVVSAHVASSDVQLLADKNTGEVLIVDFDQARSWAGREYTDEDAMLVRSFANEVMSLVDDADRDAAKQFLVDALTTMGSSPGPEATTLFELLQGS